MKLKQNEKTEYTGRVVKMLFMSNIAVVFLLLSSCANYSQKLKSDFVGFSNDVTTSYTFKKCIIKKWRKQSPPYDLLYSSEDEIAMRTAVNSLKQDQNTSAYYALDKALDRVEYVQKKHMEKDPGSKYYVIMLTDGLDNYSGHAVKAANKWKYRNKYEDEIDNEYPAYLKGRMDDIMKTYKFFNLIKKPNATNSFQSFVLLFKGADIKASGYTNDELKAKLRPFTGAQNAKYHPEPIMSEDIDELTNIFIKEMISRDFAFVIPKSYVGKRIRMVVHKQQENYIEGDFVREGRTFLLKNITMSENFTMEHPTSIPLFGRDNGGAINFSIKDVRFNDLPVKASSAEQWFYESGKLRINSEYISTAKLQKNAYVIVILDGSQSFKEKFSKAQNSILKIIEEIREQ